VQTTLLDVLAGHTYTGTVGGHVMVNGKPRHLKSFLRIRCGCRAVLLALNSCCVGLLQLAVQLHRRQVGPAPVPACRPF